MTCQESMRPSSSMSKTKPPTKNAMPRRSLMRCLFLAAYNQGPTCSLISSQSSSVLHETEDLRHPQLRHDEEGLRLARGAAHRLRLSRLQERRRAAGQAEGMGGARRLGEARQHPRAT